jgi:hypothetical protein
VKGKKNPPRPIESWGARSPAALVDQDAWPIRPTARVQCRRNGKGVSGVVASTYLDHRQRPVVEVETVYGVRSFRPDEVRVQRRRS